MLEWGWEVGTGSGVGGAEPRPMWPAPLLSLGNKGGAWGARYLRSLLALTFCKTNHPSVRWC